MKQKNNWNGLKPRLDLLLGTPTLQNIVAWLWMLAAICYHQWHCQMSCAENCLTGTLPGVTPSDWFANRKTEEEEFKDRLKEPAMMGFLFMN